MPRRRPRVGRSTTSTENWAPGVAPPPDSFTLEFDDNLFDYTFDVGGAAIPWKDQLDPDPPPLLCVTGKA
jgi:hypothetical protein